MKYCSFCRNDVSPDTTLAKLKTINICGNCVMLMANNLEDIGEIIKAFALAGPPPGWKEP